MGLEMRAEMCYVNVELCNLIVIYLEAFCPQAEQLMKTVDTRDYIRTLRELSKEGKSVSLLVTGNSMAPFLIGRRDYVYFRAPERPLRQGDIVFYERDSGQFVLHRIVRVRYAPDGSPLFDICGDNQAVIETGVRPEQIFARIYEVKRKGKLLRPGIFWWDFFERIWLHILPFRRGLSRLYACLARPKR